MTTPFLEPRVKGLVARYLNHSIDVATFQQLFVEATWDVELPESAAITEMVGEIELRLAEYTSGHWTEDELRALLAWVVQTASSMVPAAVFHNETTYRVSLFALTRHTEMRVWRDSVRPAVTPIA